MAKPPKYPHTRKMDNEDFAPGTGDIFAGKPYQEAQISLTMFAVDPNADNKFKNLCLKMASDKQDVIGGSDEEGYYIAIAPTTSWRITFRLSDDWNWRFDPEDPITFKKAEYVRTPGVDSENPKEKNYRIYSISSHEIVLDVTSTLTSKPPTAIYPGTVHPFNLYVIVTQSEKHTIPIRIDPDVKNPPPGGSKTTKPFIYVPIE